MHASLVRVNRATDQLEPDLAEAWELQPDQRTYRLRLRENVRFSDGSPFSAADVVFSFRAAYDERTGSVFADSLQVDGKPIAVVEENASTVLVRFPRPFSPGLRMLDGVPIYPRHRLSAALDNGSFRHEWGTATDPSDLAGLGPFVLRRYVPGQLLTFDRNPFYWQRGFPKLAHITVEVVHDQESEALRLGTGEIDLTQTEIRPLDMAALRRRAADGSVALRDAGISLDGDLFWINLSREKSRDARSAWMQSSLFRRAIAHAIDRDAFADAVYLGAAVSADSIVSPGNSTWHTPASLPRYDLEEATRLLRQLDLVDRNGDGILEDSSRRDVRFALLTQKGNTSLERGAEVIRETLRRIGVRVDIVALEPGAVADAIMHGAYDAAYFRLVTTDSDPALNLDFWLSSGSAHVWNPEQKRPSTAWEAKIDTLMLQMASELERDRRRALFDDVQRIAARELPVLCFAFPRITVAFSRRVTDATPAPYRPPILWNPAVLDARSH